MDSQDIFFNGIGLVLPKNILSENTIKELSPKEIKEIKETENLNRWLKKHSEGMSLNKIARDEKIRPALIYAKFKKYKIRFKKYPKKNNPKCDLHRQIRNSKKYIEWRTAVFVRDDYTCQKCKTKGCYIEAHHIINFATILKEQNITDIETAENNLLLFDINNGISLCKSCHDEEHLLLSPEQE